MEHAVGQWTHADAVAVVKLAQHHPLDVVRVLLSGIHILHTQLLGTQYYRPHGIGTVAGIHLADVLAAARQFGQGSLVGIDLQEALHQSPARAVGVAAHHYFLRLRNPFGKGLVALADISLAAAGHADYVGESALHQGESVLLALGDDEAFDGFRIEAQRVDAVDAVRGTGLCRRFLPEVLDVSAVWVLGHASHLHVHDAAAHTVAIGDGRHLLVALRVVALRIIHLVRHVSAAYASPLRRLHRDTHILEILLHHGSCRDYILRKGHRASLGSLLFIVEWENHFSGFLVNFFIVIVNHRRIVGISLLLAGDVGTQVISGIDAAALGVLQLGEFMQLSLELRPLVAAPA